MFTTMSWKPGTQHTISDEPGALLQGQDPSMPSWRSSVPTDLSHAFVKQEQ